MANKVQFNLKNVHYAILTEAESQGVITETYGTPVKVPGAVSISLSQNGELTPFYADGIKYYISHANNGYEGDLEMALIPDTMLQAIWGFEEDSKDVLIENANTRYKDFALLFEIEGDTTSSKYVLYKCTASRPPINSQTNQDTKEPQTQTISIQCSPLVTSNDISGKTTDSTDSTVDASWFTSVHKRTS